MCTVRLFKLSMTLYFGSLKVNSFKWYVKYVWVIVVGFVFCKWIKPHQSWSRQHNAVECIRRLKRYLVQCALCSLGVGEMHVNRFEDVIIIGCFNLFEASWNGRVHSNSGNKPSLHRLIIRFRSFLFIEMHERWQIEGCVLSHTICISPFNALASIKDSIRSLANCRWMWWIDSWLTALFTVCNTALRSMLLVVYNELLYFFPGVLFLLYSFLLGIKIRQVPIYICLLAR